MKIFRRTEKPFLVMVTEDRYDMYGDPRSFKHHMIAKIIKDEGGISDTVPPGTYQVTLKVLGFRKFEFNMQPKQ